MLKEKHGFAKFSTHYGIRIITLVTIFMFRIKRKFGRIMGHDKSKEIVQNPTETGNIANSLCIQCILKIQLYTKFDDQHN